MQAVIAERLHPFFTASPHYPADIPAAWEDGKRRFREMLERQSKTADELTLADYCRATGSDIEG